MKLTEALEQSGKLELSGGVRMEDAKNAFNTASSWLTAFCVSATDVPPNFWTINMGWWLVVGGWWFFWARA